MLLTNMNSILFIGCLLLVGVQCQDDEVKQNKTLTPKERMFSFLQVMRFPNDVCAGSSGKNGTCYTSDECTAKGGVNAGSCANGFGVCCVFTLSCGQSSSENNTFLVLGATSTPPTSVCTYTLCETNANICRIRLDFTTFAISGPVTGSLRGAVGGTTNDGGAIGDCAVDTFVLSAPGNRASPVICGTNTGQHMFIDTSNGCAKATFDFGVSAFTRSYEIRVTQFNCGDEMAGPSDCLQYYTGNTGTIRSFNFLPAATVDNTATHLSNQLYSICFRRNSGKCTLCFFPTISATAPNSFGLSVAIAGPATSQVDATCTTDYLMIPNAVGTAVIAQNPMGVVTNGAQRICGRFFASAGAATASASVCTGQRPFKVIFNTDANEVVDGNNAGSANLDEQSTGAAGPVGAAGILGFALDFTQGTC